MAGLLDIVAPPTNLRSPATTLQHQTLTVPEPAKTGFVQVDSLRSALRGRLRTFLSRHHLQTIQGYSSITANTPAKVSAPGFGLVIGQIIQGTPAASAMPSGPPAGAPNAYMGPVQSRFAVKVG